MNSAAFVHPTAQVARQPADLDDSIAVHIREHQQQIVDWRYAGLEGELHRWIEIFNVEFKLELPAYPVLRFTTLRGAYAAYASFRTEVGLKDNITFNTRELTRDVSLIIRTLCHELIHVWQQYRGKPSGSRYHNAEFRQKAASCGLIVYARGCTTAHTSIFSALLSKHGVQMAANDECRLWGAHKNELKMKKWSCGCTDVRLCREPFGALHKVWLHISTCLAKQRR